MVRHFRIPYVIYWLLVKDFFYDVDVCDSNNNEPGHCLPNTECNIIGTNIGSCDSDTSDFVCCKITINYFNETYLLEKLFVRKSQTDVVQEMVIHSSDSLCGQSVLQYGNRSMLLKKKEQAFFIPDVHVSETPDRIIWPVWASYSRRSKDLNRQSFGTNHLYVVELNKLVSDENDNMSHPVSECISESDDDEKFYTFLNIEKRFPVRKFFTQRIQKFNTMNLTIDALSFIEEIEPEIRSRRSIDVGEVKPEYLSCEKEELEDVLNVEGLKGNRGIQNELEISHNFFKQMHNSAGNLENHIENMDSVINYVSKPKVVSKELVEQDDINEESSSDKENGDKITPDEPFFKKQFSDSSTNSKNMEEEKTAKHQDITFFDKMPIKSDSSYELDRHLKQSVFDNIRSHEREVIHDFRKPVQVAATHDMRDPVQLEATHDMRKPVQVHETHDMRKPVKVEFSHDMRIAVQNNNDHNMRKPVETRRVSVQRENTHNMRKPVTSDESHDLRWPVLEGENDLRNVYRENDSYRKIDGGTQKIEENLNLISKNSSLDCNVYISLFSKKSASTENQSLENQKKNQLNDLWERTSRVCGNYSGVTTETSSSKTGETWPWMVSLHENISGRYKHKCSASLLNSLWVITVAHCVDMKPIESIMLVLGNLNLKDGKVNVIERAIDEIVLHPKFNRGLFENDLALLRMKTPVTFQSAISPICLPWTVGELSHGIPVFLGWKLKDKRTTDDLHDLTVPIMSNYECEILYSTGKRKEKLKDTFLCAGKEDMNCDSVSGSSLIALDSAGRWSLIGLVSWSSMCNNPELPCVYMRISSYTQWIKDVIDCYEILM